MYKVAALKLLPLIGGGVLFFFLNITHPNFFSPTLNATRDTISVNQSPTPIATSTTVSMQDPRFGVPMDDAHPATTVTNTSALETPALKKVLAGMHLTFDDEFNSFSEYLDANGNTTCNSGGSGVWQTVFHFCSRTIPTNYESEVYSDENFLNYLNSHSGSATSARSPFSISGGVLSIEAAPSDQAILAAAGSWAKYTSGLITTQFSFSQKYGYFETRAKLPKGRGLWPAFWLLPIDKSWPPEVDAMEAFGDTSLQNQGGTTLIHYASHSLAASESCGEWHDTGVNIYEGFHRYGVDIEPTGITYYFDGTPYATCKPNSGTNQPFYMVINLAVGSAASWPGAPDASTTWPAHMYVDYVRAYQKN